MEKLTLNDIFSNKAKVIKSEFQGQEIFVKELTPAIRQIFTEQATFTEQQKYIISTCLVNEDGSEFFSKEEKAQLDDLKAEYVDVLFTAIMQAVSVDDREIAKN